MFVIEAIMVEDKNLGKVLKALHGNVHSMKLPRPVNAEMKNGKLISKGNSLLEIISNAFDKHPIMDNQQMTKLATDGGYSQKSIGSALTKLIEAKRLKRVGRGRYQAITPKRSA